MARRTINDLMQGIKSDSKNIWVSGIVQRQEQLNTKAKQINVYIKNKCNKKMFVLQSTRI